MVVFPQMMSQQKSRDLADQFFAKTDTESAVGFEIAFAALLATAVITYPTSQAQWVGEAAAFAVLLITLVRRMVIASPFASEANIMKHTVRLIEFATATCVIVLLFSLSEFVARAFSGNVIIWFSILTPLLLLIGVYIQEFLFRDYLVWWYAKFNEKEQRGDAFEPIWKDIKLVCLWASRARRNRRSWKELGKRTETSVPDLSDVDFDVAQIFKNVFGLVLLLSVLYLPSMLIGVSSGSFLIPIVLPGVIFAHDHSCYQYIAYGNASYEEFRKPIWEIAWWAIAYVTVVLLLLGRVPFEILL